VQKLEQVEADIALPKKADPAPIQSKGWMTIDRLDRRAANRLSGRRQSDRGKFVAITR
jgi:hypothetical protein